MRKLQSKIRSKLNRNVRIGDTPPAVSVPVIIFEANPVLDRDDPGNPENCFRVVCTLTAAMQEQFRVTIRPALSDMLTISHMGAGAWVVDSDTVDPPIALLFGGNNGFVDKTTDQISDWLDSGNLSSLGVGDKIVITFRTGLGGHSALRYNNTAANTTTFFQVDPSNTFWDDASTEGKGFTGLPGINYGIVAIETQAV